MTRQKVLERLCKLQEKVMNNIQSNPIGWESPADCFCKQGGFWNCENYKDEDYRNDGKALEFIEDAVKEKLKNKLLKINRMKKIIRKILNCFKYKKTHTFGTMDNSKVFNRALTQKEITKLYEEA